MQKSYHGDMFFLILLIIDKFLHEIKCVQRLKVSQHRNIYQQRSLNDDLICTEVEESRNECTLI